MKVGIIGGGAAGMFAAVNLKELCPAADVTVVEAGARMLAKVAVTGGGRCNLTNTFADVRSLESVYPRGHRLMKRLLHGFSAADTWAWFEGHGVPLAVRRDFDARCSASERECVFPASQDAQTVVRCLTHEARKRGVRFLNNARVAGLTAVGEAGGPPAFEVTLAAAEGAPPLRFDRVLVTTGGCPAAAARPGAQRFPCAVGVRGAEADVLLPAEPPVPSLFTFSLPASPLRGLMGLVVDPVGVAIAGTKLRADGALLATHWGVSGPAVLRLSSYAARHLADTGYRAVLLVNWLHRATQAEAAAALAQQAAATPQRQVASAAPLGLPHRLWQQLAGRADIPAERRWAELGRRQLNRLADLLTCDAHAIEGKSRWKEEFVTCGGISPAAVDARLQCRAVPGLYFAGEVLDVDAVTGGFNLQAAWTMGMTAARAVAQDAAPA